MLIGISGPPCAGKAAIDDWLVRAEGFQSLRLIGASASSDSAGGDRNAGDDAASAPTHAFATADDALRFVMAGQRWRQDWVVWPVETGAELELLRRRPFFLWLAVDAPLLLRHRRFAQRDAGTRPSPDYTAS